MSMTLRFGDNTTEPAGDAQPPEAEQRMRRALGLLPGAAVRPRSRAAEGSVIVEHRTGVGERHHERGAQAAVNRIAQAEAALAAERAAREQLVRQLRDAEAALREAQTKWGHAELARAEAAEALTAERAAREAAEAQLRERASVAGAVRRAGEASPERDTAAADAPPRKRRGRPPGSKSRQRILPIPAAGPDAAEDLEGAVAWWEPGWQEKFERN